MRLLAFLLALAAAALLAACSSTPDERIAKNPGAFDQYPVEVQQKIRAGQVEVGFAPGMVLLAWGQPSRVFNRQSETGVAEVWVYHDNKPQFSFGVGVGSYNNGSGGSVGVGTSTGGYDPEEKMRAEFRDGKVVAVEYRKG
jgi:hypothetical protein